MKKALSIIIAAAMVLTGCFVGISPVSAAVPKVNPDNVVKPGDKKKEKTYKEGEALVLLKTGKKLSRSKASSELGGGSDYSVEKYWDFEEPEEITTEDTGRTLSRQGRSSGSSSLNIVLVKSSKYSTKELVRKLNSRKDVIVAEPNYRVKAYDVNDAYFGYQWALKNTGQNGGTAGKSVNTASKWDKGITGSKEKVVAVVDTGVDYSHEDLRDNIWENPYNPRKLKGEHGFDFVNGDDDPMDDNGHGTHCAGIIGATGNNSTGISGVNQNVKIMAIKFLDDDGSGYGSDEISAYHYINKALDLGVDVVAINNSWGGGYSSEIFEKLVDIVGKKGAVSVCAAGNSSDDNDEYGDFPSNIDSEYVLSVAAANEKGELATFSNYGAESVDLAAPGTDILSTVSYNCYNPTIYDKSKQESVSQEFSDFEDGKTDVWGVPTRENISGSATDVADKYSAEIDGAKYFGKGASGSSLKLKFSGMKKGEWASASIPYKLSDDVTKDKLPNISMMAKVSGPVSKKDAAGVFLMVDMPADEELPSNPLELLYGDYYYTGFYVNGEDNYWDHLNMQAAGAEITEGGNFSKDRKTVLYFYSDVAGDYGINIDDFGLSKECDGSAFGKYDFFNGTSMATPAVTGAVALTAAELKNADASTLADTVMSYVDEADELKGKVVSGGSLDFSRLTDPAPRIGTVKVSVDKKQITVSGGSLGKGSSVKVTTSDKKVHNAEIVSSAEKKIVIKDKGWINTVVDIEVTNGAGKTAKKKGIYLVNGKKSYTELSNLVFPGEKGILATDGRKIYAADSDSDTIYAADTKDGKKMEFNELSTISKPEKYFKKDKKSLATFDFGFGYDLVYMDGKLYNVAAYSEVGADDEDDDDGDWAAKKSSYDDWSFSDDDDDEGSYSTAYASQYRLMSFSTTTGKKASLGNLPSDMERIGDYTLAGYNGKLYLIGGYDYGKKKLSTKVKIYDPATKKWSNGPSLPSGRAGGVAVQSGNSLVYTYGYSPEQKNLKAEDAVCPVNLVLTGKKWKTSKATMEPYFAGDKITRSGNTYYWYTGSASICGEGVFYTGNIAKKLGDTFTYSPSKDRFRGTKYNFIKELDSDTYFAGITVGSTLYGFDDDDTSYKAGINSGLVKVKAAKYRHGRIINANKGYMPGSKVKLTAKPNKGYAVKSFTVSGKKVNGNTGTIRITKNHTAKATFVKGVSKIKLNKTKVSLKAGKTFQIKAKVYPEKLKNKKVTYKSSNKKYATVSSKGLVKAKRAGKGRTVTITVKAKDGSGVTAKCKVRIK